MSQQQTNPGNDDEGLKLIVIFCILIFIAVLLIATVMDRINAFVGAISWIHVLPFAFLGKHVPIVQSLPFIGEWLFTPAISVENFLSRGGFATMEVTGAGLSERNLVMTAAGRAAFFLYGPFMLYVCFRGYEFRPDHKYKTRHSLDSMIREQTENWHSARMNRKLNPLKLPETDLKEISIKLAAKVDQTSQDLGRLCSKHGYTIPPPTWGRALRPEEWLVAEGLLFDKHSYEKLLKIEDIRSEDFEFRKDWEVVDIESLCEVLSAQLRTLWTQPQDLKPCHKALFAVMALFYNYEVEAGNELVNNLGLLASTIELEPGAMDKAMQSDPYLSATIEEIVSSKKGQVLAKKGNNHAWLESAFPTFLYYARKNRGVLPAAGFAWLKSQDRTLWYILNNLGNEAIMIEAAGALAHNRAETQIGKPIYRPHVYQAARSMLEDYMDMTLARREQRRIRLERSRRPGEQIDLILKASFPDEDDKITDFDGLDLDYKNEDQR